MSSAEIFCWGSFGPAGGEENRVPVPVEEGRKGLVRKVHAGGGRALLARAEDVEWLPNQGDLRDGNGDNSGDEPRKLPGVENAAFGQAHTLVLRTCCARRESSADDAEDEPKTEVLSWGSGEQGQLGLGAASLESKLPKAIPALSAYRVVQVACGAQHSAAVTSSGDLFTWGRGTEGQLGHASPHLPPELNDAITGIQLRPKPVPAFLARKKRQRPVAGVSCGANFTLVVTRAGEAWAFGGGAAGQLGIGRLTSTGVPKVVMPSCPATGKPFVEVAAGWAHALARTSGGRIYSWGFNALGSLGLGDSKTRFFPEAVPLGGGQYDTKCRDDRSDGLVGSGLIGGDATSATAVGAVVKVDACGNCSGALTADGELFTWGCSNGALGHRDSSEHRGGRPERTGHVLRPRRVERLVGANVTDFALSSQGGIALVPLRVRSIVPASGPMEAGCKVVIQGHGFWDSPDIVVKFTPVSKGHKPSASRSSVGTYIPRESRQGGIDLGDGNEFLTCTAPCFASPEETFVEVSIDGTSFTADRTTFQYYPMPEVTGVTPDTCRPPFPRLRLDGEQFRQNEALMVRFEEELEEGGCEGSDPSDEAKGSLVVGTSSEDTNAPRVSRSPPRVFTVPGRVESEIIESGTDPDTELPIHEERWFITCDSPPLPPEAKLPFVSRLTVAPNGADFNGEPLRFVAHDPHADVCLPAAVPVPVPAPAASPVPATPGDEGGEESGGAEPEGPCIRITGRNLYSGADLSVRLRFGLEDESVVSFETVSFDAASESIVGVVPAGVGALVAGASGAASKEPEVPPATTVVVEVSVDGQDFFAVPDRLTVYRSPNLALHGDGVYPPTGGGWAELKTTESAYRGHEAMVRLVSKVHGFDVVLPLLSSPPPQEVEESAETTAEAPPCAEAGAGASRPPSAGTNKKTSPPVQAPAKGAEQAPKQEPRDGCDGASTEISDAIVWEEQEVPVSNDSFFFAVPPLSELVDLPGSPDGQDQDAAAAGAAATQGEGKPQPAPVSPKSPAVGGGDHDGAEAVAPEEVNIPVSLLVSLNGNDWQPVVGPSLTYFQPPPEPVPEPEEEPKKGKGKRK